MLLLSLGLLLFLSTHSVRIVADDWRSAQLARHGEGVWKGLYSLLSLIGLALIAIGYGQARAVQPDLWPPPLWTHHLTATLMLPALVLLTAAYVPGNRIRAWLHHPMILGVQLWAVAHLMANNRLADLLLFGTIFIWALLAFRSARRRDRQNTGKLANETIQNPAWRDGLSVVIGVVAWVVFARWGHVALIGVNPFGA
ncbi:MAG: NnrU family protein [Leptothrix sp. (in: b-proteobacteria)]